MVFDALELLIKIYQWSSLIVINREPITNRFLSIVLLNQRLPGRIIQPFLLRVGCTQRGRRDPTRDAPGDRSSG